MKTRISSLFAFVLLLITSVAFAQVPNAPSNLVATTVSATSISLTWTDNSSNETGFQVERSLISGSGFALITTRGANVVTYSNTGLTAATTYYFRIRATNGSGSSSYTAEVSAKTLPTAPVAPSGLVAITSSMTSIALTWLDNSNNETGFEIERSLSATTGFALITTASANASSYSDGGLANSTKYYYRVRAVNTGGNSAYSPTSNATTSAPSGLTATTVSSTSIALAWSDNSSTETGFQVERSLTTGSGFALISTMAPNVALYTDAGLSPGTQYYYRVRALLPSGNSAYTIEANATTTLAPPAAPSALLAPTVSSSSVNLAWTDNSTNESGFQIERSLTTGNGFSLVTTTTANAVSYADANLVEGTNYYYRVRATNAGGTSAYTAELQITTTTPIPAAPASLTATPGSSTTIDLDWIDVPTNETGFQIERSLTTLTGFNLVTTTLANAISFTDGSLSPATKYFYRIRSVNAGGTSSYSSEANATTSEATPAMPGAFSLVATASTSANLSWSDASSNETGFQIERSLTQTGGFVLITTAAANAVSYADAGLTPGSTYYYRIRAINGNVNSAYAVGSVVTIPSLPIAPASLIATPSSSSAIILSWTDGSNNESGFQLERSLMSGSGFTLISTTAANAVSYLDNNLTAGTTYYYKVRAINGGGNSAYSLEVSAPLPVAGTTQLCENIFCTANGGVGIGTQVVPNGYRLSVNGKMMAEGVKIALQAQWPDYVFEKDYKLRDIPTLKRYITENGHLPNLPSAESIQKDGIDMEKINVLLLEKIEEMSLYLIQMEERMKTLEIENEKLKRIR